MGLNICLWKTTSETVQQFKQFEAPEKQESPRAR